MNSWPVHGTITGPIVMIGFGSIGRGTLPLIERHLEFDRSRFVVIDPSDAGKDILFAASGGAIENGGLRVERRDFQVGGPVQGPGGPTEDAIPAWLSNGEHVQNATSTQ